MYQLEEGMNVIVQIAGTIRKADDSESPTMYHVDVDPGPLQIGRRIVCSAGDIVPAEPFIATRGQDGAPAVSVSFKSHQEGTNIEVDFADMGNTDEAAVLPPELRRRFDAIGWARTIGVGERPKVDLRARTDEAIRAIMDRASSPADRATIVARILEVATAEKALIELSGTDG